MTIATVTWTTYNNYGTILQAYALQQELLKLGFENEILADEQIIADQTKRIKGTGSKKTLAKDVLSRKESGIQRIMHILSNPGKAERVLIARLNRRKYESPYVESQKAFEQFKRQSLILREVSIDSLDELNQQYDAFIAGSDQIWSLFEETFNPFFYLDFVTCKKIAYAPCLGTDRIPKNKEQRLGELLSSFHAISVREKTSAEQLSELIHREVSWVVDPTLLRGRENWLEDIGNLRNPVKRRYILCYFLENNPWYFEQAKSISKQLHLQLKLIPSRWDHVSSEYVIRKSIGPLEFVSLFANADFVLTDSYHGSIFSILFEKRFLYLERFKEGSPDSQNMRIHSLFDALGISEMIVSQNTNVVFDKNIDWQCVRQMVGEMQRHSREYLIRSLS